MSDEIDRAAEAQDCIHEANIKYVRSIGNELQVCGTCWYCGESVTGQKKFCDRECADDWQRWKRQKAC